MFAVLSTANIKEAFSADSAVLRWMFNLINNVQIIIAALVNPLRADLVKSLAQLDRYRWSGHGVLLGKIKNDWQDRAYIGAHLIRSRQLPTLFIRSCQSTTLSPICLCPFLCQTNLYRHSGKNLTRISDRCL